MHPALAALTARRAVCAALRGLGQPKAPQPHGAHTSDLDVSSRVRVALVKLPSVPAAIRAVVVSRDRMAHFRSLVVGRWVAAAPDCVSCRCGRTFARLELFDGLYVLTEYSSRGMCNAFAIGTLGSYRTFYL